MSVTIFRLDLWNKMREIRNEWIFKFVNSKHCSESAEHDAKCSISNWYICSCESSSELFDVESLDEMTIFYSSMNNISQWLNNFQQHVNWKALNIKLVVGHIATINENLQFRLISNIKRIIQTKRVLFAKSFFFKTTTSSNQREYSDAKSTRVWLLTTWQTFRQITEDDFLRKKHQYIYQIKNKKIKKIEIIRRYHCDFVIIDEVHLTRNIDVDSFFNFEKMKANRSNHSFWYVDLFDIMISFDFTNIIASSSIMKNAIWSEFEHALSSLKVKSLKATKRVLNATHKSLDNKNLQKQVKRKLNVYATTFSHVMIRRHQHSKHDNKLILILFSIIHKQVDSEFSSKYFAAFDIVVDQWKVKQFDKLQISQNAWDAHKHESTYKVKHFDRSSHVNA